MALLKNLRFYVLAFSFFLSLSLYFWVSRNFASSTLQTIRLTQFYGFSAAIFLYLAVIIGPLTYLFPWLSWRGKLNKARRAIGVSAFYFALLHSVWAFFGQLDGFAGLLFLNQNFLLGIGSGFVAWLILSLMAATSFDFMVAKLGFLRWKTLHRLVYLAVVLITIHVLLLGTHFQDLSGWIPVTFLSALAVLLLLEANRFDAFLEKLLQKPAANQQAADRPTPVLPRFGPTVTLVILIIAWYILSSLGDKGNIPSLGIHTKHSQLALENQQAALRAASQVNLPGYLQGDKTKRFTVTFLHPEVVVASQDATLKFLVNDASSGNTINFYNKVYEKAMHLIIVDDALNYFVHLHPDQIPGGFQITTQLPHPGGYHLYQDFQPSGAIEQQFANVLTVQSNLVSAETNGNMSVASSSTQPINTALIQGDSVTKTFDSYEVTLNSPQPLRADLLSVGQQTLTFTVKDALTHQPVITLKPYLAAFGHLVMINQQTYDYLHVHPLKLTSKDPDSNGGPRVEFLPLGLYSPIKPGIYRIFAQFNPDHHLFTADFTIKIQ